MGIITRDIRVILEYHMIKESDILMYSTGKVVEHLGNWANTVYRTTSVLLFQHRHLSGSLDHHQKCQNPIN